MLEFYFSQMKLAHVKISDFDVLEMSCLSKLDLIDLQPEIFGFFIPN